MTGGSVRQAKAAKYRRKMDRRQMKVAGAERGNSCNTSELWNNLTVTRPFASSGFSIGTDTGVGKTGAWRRRSDKWKSCNASNGARQAQRAVGRRAREPCGIRIIKVRRDEMRNWWAALALNRLLVFPLCAPHQNNSPVHLPTITVTSP